MSGPIIPIVRKGDGLHGASLTPLSQHSVIIPASDGVTFLMVEVAAPSNDPHGDKRKPLPRKRHRQ